MNDPLANLGTDERARLEAVLVDFDLNWDDARLDTVVGQLPAVGPLREAALTELVKIDLERQIQRGRSVALDDYLRKFPELGNAASPDLLKADADARQHAGRGSIHLPKEFGRYRIIRPLGRGGMGGVYLARDTELDRMVALKVPRFRADDSELFERFAREARAAANLDHPNVCRVYDVGRCDGLPYITMAFVDGPTLFDILKKEPMARRRAVELARDVARAIAVAHQQGIVHRDIKPANILLAADGHPVVTDFGLARRSESDDSRLTAEGTIVGTPAYMSPEQVSGDDAGPASDVYSLGVVLYEMLAGRVPFGGSRTEIFTATLGKSPEPPSADARLNAIVLRSLAKKPADRFDMPGLASALEEWLQIRPPRRRVGYSVAGRFLIVACIGLLLIIVGSELVRRFSGSRLEQPPPINIAAQSVKPRLLLEMAYPDAERRVSAVGFSADGRQAFTGSEGQSQVNFRRWNADTGAEVAGTKASLPFNWMTFAPDSRRFLIGGGQPFAELKDADNFDTLQKFDTGANALTGGMSANGGRVIVGMKTLQGGQQVRVYNNTTGYAVAEYDGHVERIRCVALSHDGQWAYSASADRHAIWEVNWTSRPIEAGDNTVRCAVFIPGSNRVAFGYATGEIATNDNMGSVATFTEQHADAVSCLAASPDGKLVISGCVDRTVYGWDPIAGRRVWELTGLPGPVMSVVFSPDGKRFATASPRGWQVWELPE